ncbi:uncharacterized protein LOC120440833 [Oreochromis aureus]|nr:uncharacterized protein LOC120440833 [Oreochromis aureus]
MKNGQEDILPYDSGDISIFHASSFHIMLQTSFGLQIQIQHVPLMQVYVSLEQSYREKTREKYAKHWGALLRQSNSTFARCHSVMDPEIYYKCLGTERRPELVPADDQEEHSLTRDHDYCSVPEPSALDISASAAEDLSKDVETLRKEIQELRVQREFGLQRFAGSDTDIRFYTRFPSYDHLMAFWFLIEPCIYKMIRVSRAKSAANRNEEVLTPARTSTRQLLQPIDEFFLFLVFLSVGLKERDLAHRFNIHQSTVSRIIATWTNFLATALGSQCIWLTREEVQAYLPEEFKDFSDTQMILDCTELRCQTPSSPLLQSEMYSSYKSHCTMKALVGIAPHGPVTFISNLYAGSVSDKELFKQSGIAEKLTEDMAVMVDKGFLITDCCKCKVYCPPFLSKQKQMPAYQVKETQAIARLRVHVERVIRRIKQNKLFDSVITMSHVYNINQMFAVACMLSNYQNTALVKKWVK